MATIFWLSVGYQHHQYLNLFNAPDFIVRHNRRL